jgi:hypothetical protein
MTTIAMQKAITHCHYRAYAKPILRDYLYNTTFASAILNTQLQILIPKCLLEGYYVLRAGFTTGWCITHNRIVTDEEPRELSLF